MKDFYYYKGLYKVKVLTISEGYYIVESLEDFEDYQDDKRVAVKVGEQRIVQPSELHEKKVLSPPIPEHVYERQLEKRVKGIVEESEEGNAQQA
jgi:transposase